MKIAIVGSWKRDRTGEWNLIDEEDFARACNELGDAIIRNGHSLIVGSGSNQTADWHAVQGAVRAFSSLVESSKIPGSETKNSVGLLANDPIVVIQPNDRPIAYKELRRAHEDLFSEIQSPGSNMRITHWFQVQQADGILIVGGSKSSFDAGLTAAMSGKRVVPIGCFGGAGKRLISLFQGARGHLGKKVPTDAQLGDLQGPWTKRALSEALKLIGVTVPPKLLIIHGRSKDRQNLKHYLQNTLNLPEPIIMAEAKTPAGLALPEKFELLADEVDGAVAVVTADDVGAEAGRLETQAELEPRARQNVWLEVGWFWGRLGRNRILLLVRDRPAIPSDLAGVEVFRYHNLPSEQGDRLRRFVHELWGTPHNQLDTPPI